MDSGPCSSLICWRRAAIASRASSQLTRSKASCSWPAKLANTPRLEQLVRSGNLYLSAQDVIALALENNLDIAVERYGPYLSREVLRRAESGGLLRGTDVPVVAGPTSVSTAGISTASSGLAGGAGIGSGGGIVTGIGPNPPGMDPTLYA